MKKKRVGVLMGGGNAEHEVSLCTGEGIAAALEARGHDVVRVVCGSAETAGAGIDELVRRANLDTVFIALHGSGGEDGCVQGLLEILGIPYTGSSVVASALAMDKVKAKELFRLHNVPTPPYYVIDAAQRGASLEELVELHGTFGFPSVVKPRSEGSSVGLTVVKNASELGEAIDLALSFNGCALVERYVKAIEVQVGVVDGKAIGGIEVVPKSGLYDYKAKYTAGETEYFVPPRLPETRMLGVLNIAERAVAAIGCTGVVRVDMLVTEGGNEYVLEVNTLPGFTATSLIPKIAAKNGTSYGDLCETILAGAKLHSRLKEPKPAPVIAPIAARIS